MKHYEGQNFEEVVGVQGLVLVDFFAVWCGPCQMLMPVVEQVSAELTDTEFYFVDIDKYRDLAVSHRVQSVPTLVLYKDGEEVARRAGYQPKAKLIEWINSFR